MKRTDLAYVAGLIDGEGCITTSRQANKSGSVYHTIILHVEMADREPLEFAQTTLGGKIYHRGIRSNWGKPHWCWRASGEEVTRIIKPLLPYLILKRPQAVIALRIYDSHPKFKHLTATERFLQEANAKALVELKK